MIFLNISHQRISLRYYQLVQKYPESILLQELYPLFSVNTMAPVSYLKEGNICEHSCSAAPNIVNIRIS